MARPERFACPERRRRKLPVFLLVVSLSLVASLLRAWRVLTCFPVTAIVAPGGWATAKRPFSDFVAVRVLPRNRNPSLPTFLLY